jgi:hypothetical protein
MSLDLFIDITWQLQAHETASVIWYTPSLIKGENIPQLKQLEHGQQNSWSLEGLPATSR